MKLIEILSNINNYRTSALFLIFGEYSDL